MRTALSLQRCLGDYNESFYVIASVKKQTLPCLLRYDISIHDGVIKCTEMPV